jgi:putative hydrolase of the HAD superfamily
MEMKTLIWDFDGTLGYREGGMFGASLLEVIQRGEPGFNVTHGQIRPYLQSGFPWHTPERSHPEIDSGDQWWETLLYPIFEQALTGVGVDSCRARSMARQARAVYTDPGRWRLFDDVIPTLDLLSSRGWCHVILSNHVPELRDIVRHLGLGPHIMKVFNSAETGYEKPHPRAFETVLEDLPDPGAVWMIGDNMQADVAGANAAGIPGILVRRYHKSAEYYSERLSHIPLIVCSMPANRLSE